MITKKTVITILLLTVLAIVIYIVFKSSSKIANETTPEAKSITTDEIKTHNTKADCWTTLNGEVFDLTKFIGMHKGGDRILAACGIDATDLFTGKSSLGRVHSQIAIKLLESMKIGTLQQ